MGRDCNPSPQDRMSCPLIYSTDLNGLMCKGLEEADLTYSRSLMRPAASLIGRHAPHEAYEVQGPEGQLEHLQPVVLLSTSGVDAGDPLLPGIVDTGVGDQQAIGFA